MNKINTLLLAMSAMLTAATMQAAPVAHDSNNIYAGFWRVDAEANVARNYVANIGSRTTIASQPVGTVLADLGSDLDTVFGAGWHSASTDTSKVFWSVFSWNRATSSSYLIGLNETGNNGTVGETQVDEGEVVLNIDGVIPENTSASLATANSGFSAFTGLYDNLRLNSWDSATGTGGLSVGVGMTGEANSFADKVTLPTPWVVGGLNLANLEAWVGDTANGGKAGDQWIWNATRKSNGSDTVNSSTFLKQLTVESNGQVMVIPEPSTYALFGFGLLLMVVAYRRKISA
jgi:hypothetical protein